MTRWLERLDRRWIFFAMGLLVLLPLLFPLSLPLTVSGRVRAFHDGIARIPDGSTVLMSCDYDPGAIPELVPMTRTALRQLFDKKCKVVVTCLWPGGPGLVDNTVRAVADEMHQVDGVDYVDLGFKEGREAVMVLMGQGIANAFPRDYQGKDTRSLPIMRNVRNYSSFPLLVNISAGYPGTKEWVQQVQSRFHLPMVAESPRWAPSSALSPDRTTGGLLGGMAGAARVRLRGGRARPLAGWTACRGPRFRGPVHPGRQLGALAPAS